MNRENLTGHNRRQLVTRLHEAIYFLEGVETTVINEKVQSQYNAHLSTLIEIETRMKAWMNQVESVNGKRTVTK